MRQGPTFMPPLMRQMPRYRCWPPLVTVFAKHKLMPSYCATRCPGRHEDWRFRLWFAWCVQRVHRPLTQTTTEDSGARTEVMRASKQRLCNDLFDLILGYQCDRAQAHSAQSSHTDDYRRQASSHVSGTLGFPRQHIGAISFSS